LPREEIYFAKRTFQTDNRCDWTKPAGNEEVIHAVDLNDWLCVYPKQRENVVEKFVNLANECARRIGIRLSMPKIVPLRDDKPDTYYQEIKKSLSNTVSFEFNILDKLALGR
jgi:hypothetical protein